MVRFALKKLDDDIHSLAFESDVRKKLMNETLTMLMDLHNNDLANNLPGEDSEQAHVKNGAVYSKPSRAKGV